jgi:hypothetical protein
MAMNSRMIKLQPSAMATFLKRVMIGFI